MGVYALKNMLIKIGDDLHKKFKLKCYEEDFTLQDKIIDLIKNYTIEQEKDDNDDSSKDLRQG